MGTNSCDYCSNFIYDEDYDCYCCTVEQDEDEVAKMASFDRYQCPYFRMDDEYKIVRKQM